MVTTYKLTKIRKCEICDAEFYGSKMDHYHKKHPEFKFGTITKRNSTGKTYCCQLLCKMPGCTWKGQYKQLLPHYRRCHSGQIKPTIVKIEPTPKTADVLYIADLIAQLGEKIKAMEKRNKEQEVVMNQLMADNISLRSKLANREQEAQRLEARLMQAQETLLRKD
jgi:hypothetical protein